MKLFTILSATILSLVLIGCAANMQRDQVAEIGFTYATIKLISNSSSYTSEGVMDKVTDLRQLVDQSLVINTQTLVDDVLRSVSPEDRFLIQSFLVELEFYVLQAELPEDRKVRIGRVLDAVERGAMLSAR